MVPAPRTLMLAGTLGLIPGAAHCDEWSVTPVLFVNADYQSNRILREGTPESQSLGASLDLGLVRRSETSELAIAPHYYMRRIDPKVESDINDLRVPATLRVNFERADLTMQATYADESTLTTELAQTGEVYADASRILGAASASWRLSHSDSRELNLDASYQDVNYTGRCVGTLTDYRYASLSAGERFIYSPRTSWSLTAFGSQLRSPEIASESSEAGVSLGYDFAWSERTSLSAGLGFSQRDFDGDHSTGRVGYFSFLHRRERREWRLNLDHSLVPFGTGVLTERDTAELSLTQDFDARLRGIARLSLARNEDVAGATHVDVRTYRYADLELRWQVKETWSVGFISGYSDAQEPDAPQRVGGWTVALRTTWAPNGRVL